MATKLLIRRSVVRCDMCLLGNGREKGVVVVSVERLDELCGGGEQMQILLEVDP
jgi:hypothetical protein